MSSLVALASVVACPYFVEIFPDPTEVSDNLGEFIEIRLSENKTDTLFIQPEGEDPFAFTDLKTERLVLHRDSLFCKEKPFDCLLLPFKALPNSRETSYYLKQGNCTDSITLAKPKPGKSFQRISMQNEFSYATPSPGLPGENEPNVLDCALEIENTLEANGNFQVRLALKNCEERNLFYKLSGLDFLQKKDSGQMILKNVTTVSLKPLADLNYFLAYLEEDESPKNDTAAIYLSKKGKSILQITEVHFCPEEGFSEWIEIYNALPLPVPLKHLHFLNRGLPEVSETDSIRPFESILLTKDTTTLRAEIGFKETRIFKANLGSLKNTGDTIALLFDNDTLDYVSYGKRENAFCPLGFNPLSGNAENTPGFQGKQSLKTELKAPFRIEINKRVFSKKKGENPQIKISGMSKIRLVLLSESGKLLWEKSIQPEENTWFSVPFSEYKQGIYFLKGISGNYAKNIGIVLRP